MSIVINDEVPNDNVFIEKYRDAAGRNTIKVIVFDEFAEQLHFDDEGQSIRLTEEMLKNIIKTVRKSTKWEI